MKTSVRIKTASTSLAYNDVFSTIIDMLSHFPAVESSYCCLFIDSVFGHFVDVSHRETRKEKRTWLALSDETNPFERFLLSLRESVSLPQKRLNVGQSDITNRPRFVIGNDVIETPSSSPETPASWPPRPASTVLRPTCVAGCVVSVFRVLSPSHLSFIMFIVVVTAYECVQRIVATLFIFWNRLFIFWNKLFIFRNKLFMFWDRLFIIWNRLY